MIRWLLFTLLAVGCQGFFALFEMACVSFNRVRLQYFVSKGKKRAMWLQFLLERPTRLFGTTLVGISTALQVGSECARRFYESIHLNPDWAPLTQVFIVVIFSELAPMFAARRHPEQIALALAPIMILIARILSPITWMFGQLSNLIHFLMRRPRETPLFLSREEVMAAFEEREGGEEEFHTAVASIFQLKNRTAGQVMTPLASAPLFSSLTLVRDARLSLSQKYTPILPIYHKHPQNIVAITYVRSLLRLQEQQKILDSSKPPWFVTKETSVLQILDQFRRNNQTVAVILDPSGQACGILTLDQIVDSIFGRESADQPIDEETQYLIERTLDASMTVQEFNQEFGVGLSGDPEKTLGDFVLSHLDHSPYLGETVKINGYEFTIEELSLRGIRTLSVRTTE